MHQYIKVIGFDNIKTRSAERNLLNEVEKHFSQENVLSYNEENHCEYRKHFGDGIGIATYGEINEEEKFNLEYYFPYLKGETISSYADIIVDKKKDNNSYMGICEDVRIGVSLIFFLQNPLDYIRVMEEGSLEKKGSSVSFTGLMQKGTVLFPIEKNPVMEKNSKEESRNRMMLVSAARKGDTQAMETLTLEDMDIYSQISKRIIYEDVFSIVDTYFMPYGIECDEYSIMGEIKKLDTISNEYTQQKMYKMLLEINEMHIEICVPKNCVLGEPEIGRRFKGTVWLQGHINFPE